MDWLLNLIQQNSVPHALLVVSLVVASGLTIGRIPLAGIRLGIAGVLFSGLLFGHFQLRIEPQVMQFVREFGLVLFVYTIGLQVGPSFVSAFFRYGLRLNALAAAIVALGVLIIVLLNRFADIESAVAVGLFAGATTNTPALAAAQQALASAGATSELLKMPGLGYAVAYPFGIIGIILSMLFAKRVFKVDVEAEAEWFALEQTDQEHSLTWQDLRVENPNLQGIRLAQIGFFAEMGAVVTRVLHAGASEVTIANADTKFALDDVIRIVAERHVFAQLHLLIGHQADVDLKQIDAHLQSRRLLVTNVGALNQRIGDLCMRYSVSIPRLHRPEVEFAPASSVRVQFGDELHVVGTQESLDAIEKLLGNSMEQMSHPQIMPIFIGIALGVLLGSMPIYVPGMPSAVKLGMAGGPLLMAMFLSRVGNWGAMTWHLPKSSNMVLKDIGIVLFLACVGLNAGDQFVKTLTQGQGLYWMLCAAVVTLLPLLIVAAFARISLKLNYLSLCGLLAGSMTDPPALAFANHLHRSPAVSMAYATVYPLVMILRIVAAQMLVLLL